MQADVGKQAFLVDDNTAVTTNSIKCGVVGALVDSGMVAVLTDGRVS